MISQVIGPVIDVDFPSGNLPSIYNAIRIQSETSKGVKIDAVIGFDAFLQRFRSHVVRRSHRHVGHGQLGGEAGFAGQFRACS